MNYTQVKIFVEADKLEPLILRLEDMGIGGFVVEDPKDFQDFLKKKKGYEWDYVDESLYELENVPCSVTFYLEDSVEGVELLDKVTYEAECVPAEKVEICSVCDDDWKDKWKEYFKPSKITERIVVKPSWEEYKPTSGEELIIEIDPGMAFGTGTHPTTVLCIRAIEKYLSEGKTKILDVGCGSGILAMAGALLGASQVLGIEIDPDAVRVARENVERNGLSDRISVTEGDLTKGLDWKADLVVANLMADLVIMLSADVEKHLLPGGVYISSGILIEKKEQVAEAVRSCGFTVLEIPEEGEWCAIVAKKAETGGR